MQGTEYFEDSRRAARSLRRWQGLHLIGRHAGPA